MCRSKLRCLYMNTPRYLNEFTSSSTSSNSRFFDFCIVRPKPTILQSLLLMTSLYLEDQFSIYFKSLLRFPTISKLLLDVKIVVSSSKSAIFELS